ncbi:MAG: 4Fe-4S dicluster domain-containing protein [Candidatus Krumholzibacteria bacterium]|nr:4Fe-4S dicluster domain-containing protein [Candidatus Krumholzibacteria bacterium]
MIRIEKERIDEFIRALMETWSVYAPARDGKNTLFAPVEDPAGIDHGIFNTDKSPKEIFFPHSEVLFEFEGGEIKKVERDARPIAVWGLRGCDARSLRLLDKVFGSAWQKPDNDMFEDPYWKEKYDDSIIFGTACNEPRSTCFCNWFGAGPHDGAGMDVKVVDTGEAFILDPVSEKGKKYIGSLKGWAEATKKDVTKMKAAAKEADKAMGEVFGMDGIQEKMADLFLKPVWNDIGAKCVNCGACAFICSTCHCFDVQDEGKKGKKGKRIRIWDTCMFPIFTMEASGHNPRDMSKDRLRQRFMHKFSYFINNYDEHLCTGCGRCVIVCPVNLDIREVVREVMACEA